LTLEGLLEKAKTTTKKWWKWILAGVLVVIVALVIWKLSKQKSQIDALKAERDALKDQAKDLEVKAKNAADLKEAETLVSEAEALRSQAGKIDEQLATLEAEYAKQEKAVEDAKDWQELRKQAKGDK